MVYETKIINCTCNPNNNITEKTENIPNFMEEVESNFFSYIVDMINYKIIGCYYKVFDINNYKNNIGFYIESFLFSIIFFSMLIYAFIGKNSIKVQYLRKEPNMKKIEKEEIEFDLKKNRIKVKNVKDVKTIKAKNIKKLKFAPKSKSKFSNPQKKKKKLKKNRRVINLNNADKNLKFKNIEMMEKISSLEMNSKKFIRSSKAFQNNIKMIESEQEKIDYNELPYIEAFEKDKRNIIQIFLSFFFIKLKTIQILFFRKDLSHFSLNFSFYIFEILLDITINSLLFSEDVITQKYFNNGELLYITTNTLSVTSNIISYFILLFTEKLINQDLVLSNAIQEIKHPKNYYILYIKLSTCFKIKNTIFYFILFIIGIFCTYYLFIFCAVYKTIQENLFTNYIVGSVWSLGFTVFICLFVTITRKIAINKRIKRLYIISKYIDERF